MGSPLDALLTHNKPTKTDMDCHNCSKRFIAELDYTINGNHMISCPWCGHGHCRVIQNGKVTSERWSSTDGDGIVCQRVWKHHSLQMKASVASEFIRNRWLERDS